MQSDETRAINSDSRRRLSDAEIGQQLAGVSGWAVDGSVLCKRFEFANYYETMAFVNAVAWIAHRADHHPDMTVGYKQCGVRYSTHSAGGLTALDFSSARAVDALVL